MFKPQSAASPAQNFQEQADRVSTMNPRFLQASVESVGTHLPTLADTNVSQAASTIANSEQVQRLSDTDKQLVLQKRQELKANRTTEGINKMMDGVQGDIVKLADSILQNSRSTEVEHIGEAMVNVIKLAKGVDIEGLNRTSRVPIIGGLINKFRNIKEDVAAEFTKASDQIEKVVGETDKFANTLTQSIKLLEQIYVTSESQYRQAEITLVAMLFEFEESTKYAEQLEAELKNTVNPDPFEFARLQKIRGYNVELEQAISDTRSIQKRAIDTAKETVLLAGTDSQMLKTFSRIKSTLIPEWKRSYMLELEKNKSIKAAKFGNAVIDAHNEIAKKNAQRLGEAVEAGATLGQRGIYDLDTLETINASLIDAANIVKAKAEEGANKRAILHKRIDEMKIELQQKM